MELLSFGYRSSAVSVTLDSGEFCLCIEGRDDGSLGAIRQRQSDPMERREALRYFFLFT